MFGLEGEPKGKRALGRPRCRWEDNIVVDRVGICELDASGPRQGPVVGPCEHGNEPYCKDKGKFSPLLNKVPCHENALIA
jgi:hypothetical protein